MNLGYSYTVDKAVLEGLIGLRKTDRDRLLRTFAELADNPFLRELIIPFGSAGYVALFEIASNDTVNILAVRHQREEDYQ